MKRHLVLVGLPGSGKTTVGGLVAQQLGAEFVDVDAVITRREGRPVPVIFAESGEAAFRDMERREVRTQLARAPAIVAPGGGWAAQPGALEEARAATAFIVYLHTEPRTATKRAGPAGIGNRPTLLGEDPDQRMNELLQERERFYQMADAVVETERRTAEAVTEDVVRLARAQAGW